MDDDIITMRKLLESVNNSSSILKAVNKSRKKYDRLLAGVSQSHTILDQIKMQGEQFQSIKKGLEESRFNQVAELAAKMDVNSNILSSDFLKAYRLKNSELPDLINQFNSISNHRTIYSEAKLSLSPKVVESTINIVRKHVVVDADLSEDKKLTPEQRAEITNTLYALLGIILAIYMHLDSLKEAGESENRLTSQHSSTQEMVSDVDADVSKLSGQLGSLQAEFNSLHEKLIAGSENEPRYISAKRGAHLRVGPSAKSESIAVMPYHTKITVLDKSDRTWLQVEVEINGFPIVGWTNRKLTKPIKTSNQG